MTTNAGPARRVGLLIKFSKRAPRAGKQGTGKSYRETPGDGRFRFINVFRILTKRTGSYIVHDRGKHKS